MPRRLDQSPLWPLLLAPLGVALLRAGRRLATPAAKETRP